MHAIKRIGNGHADNIPAFEIRDIPPRREITHARERYHSNV